MEFPELKIRDLIARIPIIQGGMGIGVSLSRLASAVASQGGIGVISAAMIGIDEKDIATNPIQAHIRALKKEIRKARQKTTGILGVNIMVALTNFREMVTTSVQEGIDVIFSGAGLPFDLPSYLNKESKTRLVPIVSSARAARIICRKWLSKYNYLPDGFVVEGPKAGGHLGFKPQELDDPQCTLENIVQDVIQEIRPFEQEHGREIPVIAAGGIYTGDDICRFIRMGAAGVQMGTRFVATHECDASPGFKESFVQADRNDTMIIKSPVGMPGRAVRNQFLTDVESGTRKPFKCPYKCLITCDHTKSPYCIAAALNNARKGKMNKGFAFAGETVWRIREILSVKELMDSLHMEYSKACS
ncbi:MAG: NAD(P)H-dependent flavin oxidoreductase [Desulfonatronovibrionaceae bacterium]